MKIVDTLEHQDAQKKVHENLRKSQLNLLVQEIKNLLFRLTSLNTRAEAAGSLVALLEDSIIARASQEPLTMSDYLSGYYGKKGPSEKLRDVDLSTKDHLYYLLVGLKLSRELGIIYHLNPPEKILEFLASRDQWLLFLVSAHLFQFPRDVVLKTGSKFPSQSLKEHVQFCLDLPGRPLLEEAAGASKEPHSDGERGGEGQEAPTGMSYSWDGTNVIFKNRRRLRRRKHKSVARTESVPFGSNVPTVGSVESQKDGSRRGFSNLVNKTFGSHKWDTCEKSSSDIFSVVLKCHKKESPSIELLQASMILKAPIAAVLAACYDPLLRMGCLATWLYSYIPESALETMKEKSVDAPVLRRPDRVEELLSKEYLQKLIAFYLSGQHVDMLIEAFKVFDENHLLLSLIQALKCAKEGNEEAEILRYLNGMTSDVSEGGKWESLESREEITNLCITAVCQGMDLYLQNRSLQQTFMRALLPCCDCFPFKTETLDWNHLLKILNILGPIETHLRIFDSFPDRRRFATVIKDLIKFLIGIEEYGKAFEMSGILNLDTADIFCYQIESEFESVKKQTPFGVDAMKTFLADAYSKIAEKNVSLKKAALLFERIAKEVSSPFLCFLSLQYAAILAHRFCLERDAMGPNGVANDQQESPPLGKEESWRKKVEQLEQKMWCFYIEAQIVESDKYDRMSFDVPECLGNWPWELGASAKWLSFDDVDRAAFVSSKSTEENFASNAKEHFARLFIRKGLKTEEVLLQTIKLLVKSVFDKELLVTAARIEQLVSVEIQDVDVMKQLLKKACTYVRASEDPFPEGSESCIFPSNASASSGARRRSTTRSRHSNDGPKASCSDEDEWVASIHKLCANLSSRYRFAHRIATLCRIANSLSLSYTDVIQYADATRLLGEVLSCESPEGFQLARELIDAFPVPNDEVNSLFFVEVISVIDAGPAPAPSEGDQVLLTWKTMDQRWPELLGLTHSPSAIGHQLMDAYHTFSKDTHPDHLVKAQTMRVEVLIRAHDCFSLAANMEGINMILQAAPGLTKTLVTNDLWSLLGRLLTGVKRYKEMAYIIDVMREHQQFERLLERPSDLNLKLQSSGLDKTLVHFLHSNYPEDREMLRMVALHFLMFSEVGVPSPCVCCLGH